MGLFHTLTCVNVCSAKKNARNLYLKRGSYWFGQQVKGKRIWVNLQTSDEAEAIRRVRLVRADPIMRPAVGLLPEVEAFVSSKRSKGRYSKNSADTKVLILRVFARWLPATATLTNVTPVQCESFYQAVQTPGFDTENRRKLKKPLKPASETTAHSYTMTLRAFFRWAVEVRRSRFDNPIERLELARVEHRARKEFCDKATKNALLAAASNDDLRFILYCGFDAGLRRDESSEARRDWFDLNRGSLQVRNADGPRFQRRKLPSEMLCSRRTSKMHLPGRFPAKRGSCLRWCNACLSCDLGPSVWPRLTAYPVQKSEVTSLVGARQAEHLIACPEEFGNQRRADKAGGAGDKDFHRFEIGIRR